MTATVETAITLSCDEPGCKHTLPGPSDYSASEVREIAHLLGWTYKPAKRYPKAVMQEADYCRAHSTE